LISEWSAQIQAIGLVDPLKKIALQVDIEAAMVTRV
jgi:hypothetical protein